MTSKDRRRTRSGLRERFWSKVDTTGPCWLWTGATAWNGYGRFKDANSKNNYAHRISWLLTFGTMPKGRVVAHRCDNPSCVNPEHLWLGTQKDNLDDAREKGRRK